MILRLGVLPILTSMFGERSALTARGVAGSKATIASLAKRRESSGNTSLLTGRDLVPQNGPESSTICLLRKRRSRMSQKSKPKGRIVKSETLPPRKPVAEKPYKDTLLHSVKLKRLNVEMLDPIEGAWRKREEERKER